LGNAAPANRGPVGDVRGTSSPGPEEAEPTYATGEAARALGLSSSRVRKMIASGELASHRNEEGRHRIPRKAVRAKLKERGFAPPTGADSRGTERAAGPSEANRSWEDPKGVLGELAQEVRALRSELVPLARLARSAQEDHKSALEENVVLREERARLLAALEEERRRADDAEQKHEATRLRWWAQQTDQKPMQYRSH
jgi:excisionase family DNA binding protein